ncbi:MAG: hypothetical protein CMP61_04845 [Flavobacteriales bacterium]|nr:hypothetical protein [Flavobacteriales bacterium]|tara:strand:- start:21152 stop:21766 length:615 start_codon:yes stop_codon:yes gene_type:complete
MKRIFKIVVSFILIFVFAIGIMILFSPYGKGKLYKNRYLACSIEVNASKEITYKILGNSDNARKWSVFVHHISTLNSNEISDGSVGSVRRCFQQEDENGLRWDEEILVNEVNSRRRLSIFNMVHFDLSADNLMTDQLYENYDGGCKLTFTIFFDPTKRISFIDELKMYFAAYKAEEIFEKNLENIKNLIERGDTYERVHLFIKQ